MLNLVSAVLFAFVATALGVWGWQLFLLAKWGQWWSFSVADGLFMLTAIPWFSEPTSWYGVHKLLSFVNAGVGSLAVGFFVVWMLMTASGD